VTLSKARIIAGLSEKLRLSRHDTAPIVEGTLEAVLERGENVKIPGFGTFVVRTKRARKGRNPHTGDEITLPEH
jgi:nucleoid DNA-binding protein